MAADGMQMATAPDDKAVHPQDIFAAAKIGNLEAVKAFAEKDDAEIDKTTGDEYPRTALSFACEHGHHNVVDYLLQLGAQGATDNDEATVIMTPLLWAVQGGHLEVVTLLDERADPGWKNMDGMTPLLIAAENGNMEVVRKLLEHSYINSNSTDPSGRTPLSVAAENNHLAVVKVLLGNASVVPDLRDDGGRTPLSVAAYAGHKTMVELLARAAPETLNSAAEGGITPLMAAAAAGRFEVIEWLLRQARVSAVSQDDNEWTALLHALQRGKIEVVRLLMHHDNIAMRVLTSQVPIELRTDFDCIPSQEIRYVENLPSRPRKYATALLNAGYDINTPDDNGITPLQSAVRRLHHEGITFLLRHNASMKGIMESEWRSVFQRPEDDDVTMLICRDHVRRLSSVAPDFDDVFGSRGPGLIVLRDVIKWDDLYDVLLGSVTPILSSFETGTHSPAAGTLNMYYQRFFLNEERVAVSVYFLMPHKEDIPQDDDYMQPNSGIRIAWTKPLQEFQPSRYFSTMPHGWTPDNEFELFEQFMRKMEEAWADTCRQARYHLAEIRTSQLEAEGRSPELINRIATLAKKFAVYRTELERQVAAASDFLKTYTSTYGPKAMVPESLKRLLGGEFEQNIGAQIEKLDQNVRDVLQVEFAWASISETRISTRLSQNVMLLTYVSIFYLPLAYCAALWAIPSMSESTKTPFITTSVAVAVITLLVAFNIESVVSFIVWAYDKGRSKILNAMQEDDVDGKWRKRGNDLHFLNPRSVTRSEWWLCWYVLVIGWRRLTGKRKTPPPSEKNESLSSSVASLFPQEV